MKEALLECYPSASLTYGDCFFFLFFFCNAPNQHFESWLFHMTVPYCPNVTMLLYDLLIFLVVALITLAFQCLKRPRWKDC